MRLILNHVGRIVAPLDLDVPLLILLAPGGTDHAVTEAHILQEAVVGRHFLEVRKNLRRPRVTASEFSNQARTSSDRRTHYDDHSGDGAHEYWYSTEGMSHAQPGYLFSNQVPPISGFFS